MSLRQRLFDANLSTVAFVASDGCTSLAVRGSEEAADVALAVFAEWLRDEAKSQSSVCSCVVGDLEALRAHAVAKALYALADKLTPAAVDQPKGDG